jgi:predicted transcriptional regulator
MTQRKYYRQIIVRYITIAPEEKEDEGDAEIEYIYQCLGLGDEKDDLGREVFKALVRAGRRGEGISSRDIMQLSEVSQAAVIYHLNMFQRSGIVIKDGRNYYLRGTTLEQTLEEIENDMRRRFDQLKMIAKKVDEKGKNKREEKI